MKVQITKENIYEMLNRGDIVIILSENEKEKIKNNSFVALLKKDNGYFLTGNTEYASRCLAEDISKIEDVDFEFI